MISTDNYNMLYEEVINNKELTTKQLNNCGFNSKDINNLIEEGIVERIKRGLYKENNTIYNSDSVGAYNIMRIYNKEKCIEITMPIKGLSNPKVINVSV